MNKYFLASATALLFGVATAIQHRAAHAVTYNDAGPTKLFLRLLRNPRWLVGRVLDTAVILQGIALRSGSLVVVQCIVAYGIVAAIGTSAATDTRWPRRRELVGSIVVVAGVVQVTGITSGRRHSHLSPFGAQWIQLGAVVALGTFVVLGVVGNVAPQRSFQIGEISRALPAHVAAEPIAALVAGMVLFHDPMSTRVRLGAQTTSPKSFPTAPSETGRDTSRRSN